ncbi:hypothetical protein MIMGU_mgv1a005150mg [Erythranthe guttata]|uniref:DNA mismatch repair proteins mutS family domain-containing protein n=1 Tax=Erythranthe guttata TaxID=4155 RepID=A0A022RXS3_ERYGU|nr:hypothetical protein MIMGU_mgv1a005150mg [Erythranthe guttata]
MFSSSHFPITSPGIYTTAGAGAIRTTTRFIIVRYNTPQNFLNRPLAASVSGNRSVNADQPSVVLDSLRVLQWDKLCDSVASFAGTSLGRQATKEQLWNLDKAYEDSVRLLEETKAAVEMNKYGAMMDFTGIDVAMVETGIIRARKGVPVTGSEAMALSGLLKFAEALQVNVKAAIKADSDWFMRFMPLSELVMELVICQPLIKFIEQLVDEDGSVKDSASSTLRNAREQVRYLERKLYQLMESMIRSGSDEIATMEIFNNDGRWCINSRADVPPTFEGLLLASGSGAGSLIEPLSAVPLNDELQRARQLVAKAEEEVLLRITKKMQMELNDIENLFNSMIQMDTINARARYSLSFEGAWPELYLPQDIDSIKADTSAEDKISSLSQLNQKKWNLYLPKAYHPLLLQQHRHNLERAMKDLRIANAEMRRKQQDGSAKGKKEKNLNISSLEMRVGAGTNPLEGAALGMSLLESFADAGALLTIATTHHGELKALKYR